MNFPTILLIGGTGKTGKRIAQQLDAKGIVYSVATRRPVQPEDRFFDWQQPVSNELFKGITAVYIVAPTHTSDHHYIVPPVLRQALAQGVKRFVLLSASSLEEGGPAMGQIHAFLHKYAPEWCVLRPTWFMQNFSEQNHQKTIREEGRIYSATGTGRVSFIDAEDIARSAVAALLAPQAPNTDFILTGPQTLSYDDVANIISKEMGYPVEHISLTVEQLAKRHREAGMDAIYAQFLASLDEGIIHGAEDRVSHEVTTLTGKEASDIAHFITRERHVWERQ
ncbi:ergot alkaloid biosynthesis protein [Pantoea ananatis]